jgi:hypothetical protein
MDFAGASRSLHAVCRLLGGAALVALLALAFATGSAHAQAQAPDAPDTTFDDPGDWGYDDAPPWPGDSGGAQPQWPGNGGGTQPQQPGPYPNPHAPYNPTPYPSPAPVPGDPMWNPPVEEQLPAVTTSYVAGTVARIRTDGRAAIPRGAPKAVRSLIGQYNRIVGKRYKWGGGHAKLVDTGYDCSGAVGYGLIKGGLLSTTMVSGSLARWGAAGPGSWVTVYANKTHVYAEVAGLRLDTSPFGDRSGLNGVRWRPVVGQRRSFKVRHPVGL